MSSPIHKYLFSPPGSPILPSADKTTGFAAHRAGAASAGSGTSADVTSAHGLTSLKSLFIPAELSLLPARISLDGIGVGAPSPTFSGADLRTRSPRTPQFSGSGSGSGRSQSATGGRFTLDNGYPSPSRYNRPTVMVEDMEQATPRTPRILSTPEQKFGGYGNFSPSSTPRASAAAAAAHATPPAYRWKVNEKYTPPQSPTFAPANVPSSSLPLPTSLPKPLLRMLFLVVLIISSIVILITIPAARLPSLKLASTSRRLAMDTDGRAYYDLQNQVGSWSEAQDRDYQPPQLKSSRMTMAKRSALAPVPAHPKAFRNAPRPLPASHELLAIQSYLLQSSYNTLPANIDASRPLDANLILSVGSHKLGQEGSEIEQTWLEDLEQERQEDIVIWYGADGTTQPPHAVLDVLAALHETNRHPTLLPCQSRSDLPLLHTILNRLSLPIQHHPLIMIGNQPIIGDLEGLEELRASGRLRQMLKTIGWLKAEESKKAEGEGWKPKMAKVKKRQLSEVEQALKRV